METIKPGTPACGDNAADLLQFWLQTHERWPKYTSDLGLEGVLAWHDATGDRRALRHVLKVWKFRGAPAATLTFGTCYFTCLHYETWLRTGNRVFIQGLVELAADWIENAPRSPKGLIGHRHAPHGTLLLDMAAGLFPLLARAGEISGNHRFFAECERQCRLLRQALRNPVTGLWHHGRGWNPDDPDALAPTGWARGQGWVFRGLFKAWEAFPAGCDGWEMLREFLIELRDAVLGFQSSCGLWRQLMHREESPIESSGSGLVLEVIARMAMRPDAFPNSDQIHDALEKGFHGLDMMVSPEGVVLNGCPEMPPARTEAEYLSVRLCAADPHAQAALLLAKAASVAFRNRLDGTETHPVCHEVNIIA